LAATPHCDLAVKDIEVGVHFCIQEPVVVGWIVVVQYWLPELFSIDAAGGTPELLQSF